MGTIRRITDIQLASIGTTKIYSLSSAQEIIFQISSGNRAFEAGNNGMTISYGQSNLLANSGLFLAASGGMKFWDTITDDFSMAFRPINGGSSQLIIQEYKGN